MRHEHEALCAMSMSFGRVVSNCRRTHRGGGPALLPRTRPSHAARHPPRRQGVSSRSHAAAADGKKQLTAAERDAVLERANESMRAYYSYPPEKLLALKKSKFNAMHRDKTFFLQLGLGQCRRRRVGTDFLGRRRELVIVRQIALLQPMCSTPSPPFHRSVPSLHFHFVSVHRPQNRL